MSYLDLYDFPGQFEPAVAAFYKANDLQAFTTRDDPQYQKVRPRVEVMYIHGAGEGRLVVAGPQVGEPIGYNYRRESAWRGQLKLEVISNATVAIHAAYVAQLLYLNSNIWTSLNQGPLKYHTLHFLKDIGCSPTQIPQKGVFQTTILYETFLSVQANAWARLTDPLPLSP